MRYIEVGGKKVECGGAGKWSDDVIACELEANSVCASCKVSSVQVVSIATGAGGVRELIVKCNGDKSMCKFERQIYSGTPILIKNFPSDPTCPARNLEELNMMLSHFLNRGEPAAMSRGTQHCGKAAITTALYMEFIRWLHPTIIELEKEDSEQVVAFWKQQSTAKKKKKKEWEAKQRGSCRATIRGCGEPAADIGSMRWEGDDGEAAEIGGDARWGTRGRSSSNATFNTAVHGVQGCPDTMEVGEEHVCCPSQFNYSRKVSDIDKEYGYAPFEGPSGEVDPVGGQDSTIDILDKGIPIKSFLGDGDASTSAAIQKALSMRKRLTTRQQLRVNHQETLQQHGIADKSCYTHKGKNLSNAAIKGIGTNPRRDKLCKARCPKKTNKDGSAGKNRNCTRLNIPMVRLKLVSSITAHVQDVGVLHTQEEVDATVAGFHDLIESEVFNHYFREDPKTHKCTHKWKHDEKYDSSDTKVYVTCIGDMAEFRALFKEKYSHKALRKIFIVGEAPRANNVAEMMQFIAICWCSKHRAGVGALEYDLLMKCAKMHVNERFHFDVNPDAPTFQEKIWHHVAERVGVSVYQLVSAYQLLAYRMQTRTKARLASQRRKKASRKKQNASRKRKRWANAENQMKTAGFYKPIDVKDAPGEDAPPQGNAKKARTGKDDAATFKDEAAKEPAKKAARPCKCGCIGTDFHQRTTFKGCPLNPQNKGKLDDVRLASQGKIAVDVGAVDDEPDASDDSGDSDGEGEEE
jgi:hypothetical protein